MKTSRSDVVDDLPYMMWYHDRLDLSKSIERAIKVYESKFGAKPNIILSPYSDLEDIMSAVPDGVVVSKSISTSSGYIFVKYDPRVSEKYAGMLIRRGKAR